jgi:hypothetical protein
VVGGLICGNTVLRFLGACVGGVCQAAAWYGVWSTAVWLLGHSVDCVVFFSRVAALRVGCCIMCRIPLLLGHWPFCSRCCQDVWVHVRVCVVRQVIAELLPFRRCKAAELAFVVLWLISVWWEVAGLLPASVCGPLATSPCFCLGLGCSGACWRLVSCISPWCIATLCMC